MSYTIQKHLTKVNKGSKGANTPEYIVFHFVGATGQAWANANYFNNVYRGASAHYFIDPTNIVQVVEDNTPAWHVGDGSRVSGGSHNGYKRKGATNNNSIGIELCQDTSRHINGINNVWHWDFHPDTVVKAEWLIRKLQKQYGIDDDHVIRHFDVSTKLCPGNWQHGNWQRWHAFKSKLAGVAQTAPTATSTNDGKPANVQTMYTIQTGDTLSAIAKKHSVTVKQLQDWNDIDNPSLIFPETKLFIKAPSKSTPTSTSNNINVLVKETLAGKHGNGATRMKSLGSNYDAVMAQINDKYGVTSAPKVSKPSAPSINQLVKETLAGKHGNGDARKRSLGSNYNAVMAVINGTAPKASSSSNSIDRLVKETLAGKHGNGDARKRSLGSNYNAVMAVINGGAAPASNSSTIDRLVKETLAGKHGNGEARKRSLGKNYSAVMKRINSK